MADAELAEFLRALREKVDEVADDAKEAFRKISDDAQYEFDKQLGKAMSQHPELYAEIRKTMRQAKRTFDKVSQDLGLK